MFEALVVVLLEHALDGHGERPPACVEVRLEVDAEALREMFDDERGVPHAHRAVLDPRRFTLGSLARVVGDHEVEEDLRHAQLSGELEGKWRRGGEGDAPAAAEREEANPVGLGVCHGRLYLRYRVDEEILA